MKLCIALLFSSMLFVACSSSSETSTTTRAMTTAESESLSGVNNLIMK